MTCLHPNAGFLLKLSCSTTSLSSSNVRERVGSPLEFSKFDAYSQNVIALDQVITELLINPVKCCPEGIKSATTLRPLHQSLKESINLVEMDG